MGTDEFATAGAADTEMGTRGQGDKETRGREQGKQEIVLLFSSSLFLLVSPSPCPLVFPSLWHG
jgi:hypothetical protein